MEISTKLTVCPECDLAQLVDPLSLADRAHCTRCQAALGSGFAGKSDMALAILLTAVILAVLMNVFPLVIMRVKGLTCETTLIGAALALKQQGTAPLGLLVFATTVLGPVVEIGLLCLVLLPTRMSDIKLANPLLIELIQHVRPWNMVEVFMLGVLVSLVKLAAFADIILGPALWACACLIVVMSLLKSIVRSEDLWGWSRGQAL